MIRSYWRFGCTFHQGEWMEWKKGLNGFIVLAGLEYHVLVGMEALSVTIVGFITC